MTQMTALEWNGRDWPSGFADRWTCTRCGRVYAGATTGKPPARCLCPDDGAIVFTIPASKQLELSVPLSAIQALIQQWQKEAQARETAAVATQRDKWKAVNFYRALAVTDCASQLAALCPTPKRPLCVCGHDVHYHEDAEGGTHECWYPGCACQQFAEVCPAPPEET